MYLEIRVETQNRDFIKAKLGGIGAEDAEDAEERGGV